MYMPTLPYKENIWKEMPQNVNSGCQSGDGGLQKVPFSFSYSCMHYLYNKKETIEASFIF